MKEATGQQKVYPLAKVNIKIGTFSDEVTAAVTKDSTWVLIGPDFPPFWNALKDEVDKRLQTPAEKLVEQTSAVSTRAQKKTQERQETFDD